MKDNKTLPIWLYPSISESSATFYLDNKKLDKQLESISPYKKIVEKAGVLKYKNNYMKIEDQYYYVNISKYNDKNTKYQIMRVTDKIRFIYKLLIALLLFQSYLSFSFLFLARKISYNLIIPIQESSKKQKLFLKSLNHDLKTPVTAINLSINRIESMIHNKNQNLQEISKWSKYIKKSNSQITSFLEKTSDLFNQPQSIIEEVEIEEFLINLSQSYLLELDEERKKIVVKSSISKKIHIDSRKLSVILQNIVSNAVQYSYTDKIILIEANIKNSFLIISVYNQGQGIKPKNINKLYDEFFREDNSRHINKNKNNGLGLSIVKEVVEGMEGSIKVESKEKEFFKITIMIPVDNK